MAIKKFLMEGQKQVWPITRADCVYTVAGDKLLNVAIEEQHAAMQKAIDDEIARAKAEEARIEKKVDDEVLRAKAAEEVNAGAIAQEVQDRINAVQDVQDQVNALAGTGTGSIGDQINAVKEELQGNINDVAEALDNEKDPAVEGSLAKQIADEATRAAGKEGELAQAIADNKDAQDEVNEDFEGRIAANEAFVAAQPAIDAEQDGRLDALEALFEGENSVDAKIAKVAQDLADFEGEQATKEQAQDETIQAAQNAADQAQREVDALEVVVGNKAGTDAEGNTIEASGMMKEIAANDAAIKAEAAKAREEEGKLQQAIDAINNEANGILAQAKVHAEAKDLEDRNAQALVDQEQDRRLGELEGKFAGDQSVDAKIAAAQAAAEAKAAELDAALKGELQGEIDGVADELAKQMNPAQEGLAKQIADEAAARLEKDNNLEGRVAANEAFVAAQPNIDAEQDRRIKALEDDAPVKQTAIEAAQGAANAAQADVDALEGRLDNEGGLVDRLEAVEQFVDDHDDTERDQNIADNKAAIEKLNGAADAEGSVAKAVKDAVDAEAGLREEADNALADRIAVFEANGAQDVAAKEVRLAAAEAKLAGLEKDTVQAAIDQAQADAEKHADEAITALVDSAPDAMNTLNELAKAINENKGIYDAYIEEHNQAMAQQKADLQAEIDADVKVVADELAKQKDAAQEGTLANQIKVEKEAREQDVEDLNARIDSIFAAYDGDQEYDDLAPLA